MVNIKNDAGESSYFNVDDVFDVKEADKSNIVLCARCGRKLKRVKSILVEDKPYCPVCVKELFQELENKLQTAKIISTTRKYCAACNTEIPEKLPEEWLGRVTLGTIALEPNQPLCLNCSNAFTTYLTRWLEERGWHKLPVEKKYPLGQSDPVAKEVLPEFIASVRMKVRNTEPLRDDMDALADYQNYLKRVKEKNEHEEDSDD